METVVALSIAAVALSFFVAAYAPATIGIQRANSVEEAKLLAPAVEAELNTLRRTFDGGAASSFEKAFGLVSGGNLLLAHKYRADATANALDGIYPSTSVDFTSEESSSSQPMSIETLVMDMNNAVAFPGATPPLQSIEGSCFAVALTQLTNNPTTGDMVRDINKWRSTDIC